MNSKGGRGIARISIGRRYRRRTDNGNSNGRVPASVASIAGAAPADKPLGKINRVYVTGALLIVMVLAAMELTVTSTAMPTIIGDLHGLEHYSWVTSVYLLVCTITMPIYGRLADVWGRKRVVLVAIALFCSASVLAASAHSLLQLIIFRGFQGLGAGGIMPVVLTILGDIFTLEERAAIQGVFSAVWGGSALAGPAIGALLVDTLGLAIDFLRQPAIWRAGICRIGVAISRSRETAFDRSRFARRRGAGDHLRRLAAGDQWAGFRAGSGSRPSGISRCGVGMVHSRGTASEKSNYAAGVGDGTRHRSGTVA